MFSSRGCLLAHAHTLSWLLKGAFVIAASPTKCLWGAENQLANKKEALNVASPSFNAFLDYPSHAWDVALSTFMQISIYLSISIFSITMNQKNIVAFFPHSTCIIYLHLSLHSPTYMCTLPTCALLPHVHSTYIYHCTLLRHVHSTYIWKWYLKRGGPKATLHFRGP